MSRQIKIITTDIQNPWINLALEEYFLVNHSKNEVVLFLWQNKDTVVIGRNQNPWSECNLPLTAAGKVCLIVTEMGVMEITEEGILLTELNPEYTVDEIQEATGAELIIADNLKEMTV